MGSIDRKAAYLVKNKVYTIIFDNAYRNNSSKIAKLGKFGYLLSNCALVIKQIYFIEKQDNGRSAALEGSKRIDIYIVYFSGNVRNIDNCVDTRYRVLPAIKLHPHPSSYAGPH